MPDPVIPERWLPVVGYEDYYEVSDFGNVRRVSRNLKPQPNSGGYPAVGLSVGGVVTTVAVHVLVAAAHIGPRPAGQDVRHGPGGRGDASADNLSYGTKKENQADRRRDGTDNRGEKHPMAKLSTEIVLECRRRFMAGETQAALAVEFGVSHSAMNFAIRGKRWGSAEIPTEKPPITPERSAEYAANGRKGAEARWRPVAREVRDLLFD